MKQTATRIVALLFGCLLLTAVDANAQRLLIWGGENHRIFLGDRKSVV